jgi:DNA-binding CsgD family transcriptional regulator
MNTIEIVPDALSRLINLAEEIGVPAFAFHNHRAVMSSGPLRRMYPDFDWNRPVSFDDCFRWGVEHGKTTDQSILRAPEDHLAMTKLRREIRDRFRYFRLFDNIMYDRHHIATCREWNALIWFPVHDTGVDFNIDTETPLWTIRHYAEQQKLKSRSPTLSDRLCDSIGLAAAAVTQDGKVIEISPAMSRAMSEGVAVGTDEDGRITFNDSTADALIRTGIAKVSSGSLTATIVPIQLPDMDLPLQVSIMGGDPDGGAVLITLSVGKTGGLETLEKSLVDGYGLTPAESQTIVMLAFAMTPAEIATRHWVSEATVRSQISSAKKKMGMRKDNSIVHAVTRAAVNIGGFENFFQCDGL